MKICPTIPQPGATGTSAKAPRGRRNLGGRSPGQCWGTTDLLSWTNVLLHCPPCQGLLVDDFYRSVLQAAHSFVLAQNLYLRQNVLRACTSLLSRVSGSRSRPIPFATSSPERKININKIEPWTGHFPSTDPRYLEQFRAALGQAKGAVVNIAVDGEHSPYALDRGEREQAITFSKRWIDAAAAIGSPSVRTNIPAAKDSEPDLGHTVEALKRVVEYAEAKNVVVNLENDNPVSEDPFFLIQVVEKVNSPWLHALPDFGNTLLSSSDPEHAYKGVDSMFGHAYCISHVKEGETNEKGKSVHVDLARTFGFAKAHGYKGYFSMEFDSPGDPYAGTKELIEKTVRYLS